MPWKECHVVDERLRFVARLLDGEKMAALCAEFGISRKTGYKIFERYKDCRPGRADRPQPAALPARQPAADGDREADRAAQAGVPELGRAQDPRAAAAALRPTCAVPAISTVHAVLDRHGLVTRRRRRRHRRRGHAAVARPTSPMPSGVPTTRASSCSPTGATATRSPSPTSPAAICSRCEALVDHAGDATPSPSSSGSSRNSACPRAIRTDNGVPFAVAQRALRPEQARRSGGCASASTSNASSPAIPSRTAATSGCISR